MRSNELKSLREARGLSLVALAAIVGTSGQQISHLELGKRHLTVEWLKKLAAALGCHPWEIVDGTRYPSSPEQRLLKLFRLMSDRDRKALLIEASSKVENAELAKLRTA